MIIAVYQSLIVDLNYNSTKDSHLINVVSYVIIYIILILSFTRRLIPLSVEVSDMRNISRIMLSKVPSKLFFLLIFYRNSTALATYQRKVQTFNHIR